MTNLKNIRQMTLPLLVEDKANHLIYGIAIYMLSYIFLDRFYAMIPVIIIGALKEVFDHYSEKNNADIFDFIWTVVGGLICELIIIINLNKL
jgi:hypothetical protein